MTMEKIEKIRHRLRNGRRTDEGFTLLELLAVMTILIVLMTIGASRYDLAVIRAHESALRSDLDTMNNAIQDYTRDKKAAPTSLDDLTQGPDQYLSRIPNDPMTGARDWTTEDCDSYLSSDQTTLGICKVHSSSNKISPFNGEAYSSW
jgi:prepilin-type N-terminal cleavage/methylation domain-containing protein